MKLGICGHYSIGREVRGVCRVCYAKLYKLVKTGEATWDDLERNGKVSKPKTNAQKALIFRNIVRS